jgi:tripartite-type tricarboxylate transporter receptor subunit TctC
VGRIHGACSHAGGDHHQAESRNVKALKSPELVAKFKALDLNVVGCSPDEFAAHLKSEVKRIGKLVRLAGAKAD